MYFNEQQCKKISKGVTLNGDELVFFLFSIKTSKCSDSCNINSPYTKICVPDVEKNLNYKLFVSNGGCVCNKACDDGEYLDYENCKCRKN